MSREAEIQNQCLALFLSTHSSSTSTSNGSRAASVALRLNILLFFHILLVQQHKEVN
jgi:hypothetical protein